MGRIIYTNQRIEILNFLKNNHSHPTVEQVFKAVRKKLSRISKATVYQNLKFLAENGVIQEVNIRGVARFEPNAEPHHHLVCKGCGKIADFGSKELTEYSMKVAQKVKGMKVLSSNTAFYGLCWKCRQGK